MSPTRVVFDCNVLLQALLSSRGPSGALLAAVKAQKLLLFVSEYVLDELLDVATRPEVQRKFHLTDEFIAEFVRDLRSNSTVITTVPSVFEFDRDPDDAHYVDLALAAAAKLIVSRDKDLLALRDPATPDGQAFIARYPELEILTPPEALRTLVG